MHCTLYQHDNNPDDKRWLVLSLGEVVDLHRIEVVDLHQCVFIWQWGLKTEDSQQQQSLMLTTNQQRRGVFPFYVSPPQIYRT